MIQTEKKWTELPPHERHRLIGEVIDAMVYHSEAVYEVQQLLESFKERGFVHSIILPDIDSKYCNQ